ncbi:UNVERIFIED_CONTAM: hypothetical protein K2H54_043279 [Gekko kuhli]
MRLPGSGIQRIRASECGGSPQSLWPRVDLSSMLSELDLSLQAEGLSGCFLCGEAPTQNLLAHGNGGIICLQLQCFALLSLRQPASESVRYTKGKSTRLFLIHLPCEEK